MSEIIGKHEGRNYNWMGRTPPAKPAEPLSFELWSGGKKTHLNPVGTLPCVGPKIWIEVPQGYDDPEVRAMYEDSAEDFVNDHCVEMVLTVRPGWVARKDHDLVYQTMNGGEIVGKFRWAYY